MIFKRETQMKHVMQEKQQIVFGKFFINNYSQMVLLKPCFETT